MATSYFPLAALLVCLLASFNGSYGATPVFFSGNGHWYEVSDTAVSWDVANVTADSKTYNGQKGYLATVTSPEEWSFIYSLLGSGATRVWLAGSDAQEEGVWRWVAGPENGQIFFRTTPLTCLMFCNWNTGEPNNSGGESVLESGGTGLWNDLIPSTTLPFLTEYGGIERSCQGPDNVIIASRSSRTYYSSPSVACGLTCQSEQRYCIDGNLNGTFAATTCSVDPCPCRGPKNETIAHLGSTSYYVSATQPCGGSCVLQERNCNNGVLSGNATQSSCSVDPCPCVGPDSKPIPHGGSQRYYLASSVVCEGTDQCTSELRTCNNSVLSGSYTQTDCQVDVCQSVYVNGGTGQDSASCGRDDSTACKTINYAFSSRAANGATIYLASGEYQLSAPLTMDGMLSASLSGSAVVDCSAIPTAVTIINPISPVLISNVNFVGCQDSAVTVREPATVVFNGVTFENNGLSTATRGGAVNIVGLTSSLSLSFVDCQFTGNRASQEGAAVYYVENILEKRARGGNFLSFQGCTFENNRAGFGGAVSLTTITTEVTFNQTVFESNTADNYGAALASRGSGSLTFIDTSLLNNYTPLQVILLRANANDRGGALDLAGATSVLIEGQFTAQITDRDLASSLTSDAETSLAFTQIDDVQFQEDFSTGSGLVVFSSSNVIFAKMLQNQGSISMFSSQIECEVYVGATGSRLDVMESSTFTSHTHFAGDGQLNVDQDSSLVVTKNKRNSANAVAIINGLLQVAQNLENAGTLVVESSAKVSVSGDVQNDGSATLKGGLTVTGNYNNTGETSATGSLISIGKDINNKGSITAASTQLTVAGQYVDTGNGEAVLKFEQNTTFVVSQDFTTNGNTTVDVPSTINVGKSAYHKAKSQTVVRGGLSVADRLTNDGSLSSSGSKSSIATKNLVTSKSGKTAATAGATIAVSETLSNQGEVQLDSSASITAVSMVNEGALSMSGTDTALAVSGDVTNKGQISVQTGATVAVAGSMANVGSSAVVEIKGSDSGFQVQGNLTNDVASTLSAEDGASLAVHSSLDNKGIVEVKGTRTVLSVTENFGNQGTISSQSGSRVSVGSNLVNTGSLQVSGNSTQFSIQGTFQNKEGANASIAGGGQIEATNIQQEGQINVDNDNGIKTPIFQITGLFVVGTDSFTSTATTLKLSSHVVLGPSSTIKLDVAGTQPGVNFDQLVVQGAVDFDGELQLHVVPGMSFKLQDGLSLDVVTFANFTGSFNSITINDTSSPPCVEQSATPTYGIAKLTVLIHVTDRCTSTSDVPPSSSSPSSDNNKEDSDNNNSQRNAAIAAPVVIGSVLLIAAIVGVLFYRRRHPRGANNEVELSQIAVGGEEQTATNANNDETSSKADESTEEESDSSAEETSESQSESDSDSSSGSSDTDQS